MFLFLRIQPEISPKQPDFQSQWKPLVILEKVDIRNKEVVRNSNQEQIRNRQNSVNERCIFLSVVNNNKKKKNHITNHNFWFVVPTGIKDLTLYPLGPTAVVLSWNRPFLGVFRKYVVEMFYFNPSTMTSEWTTYYEIAATISLTASVVK